MPFKVFKRLEIPDIVLIKYERFSDPRGFFAELYKRTPFLAEGIPYDFIQVNLSYSYKGVVRGLHYQLKPHEQGKLVYVLYGRVLDVAVDIRKGSPWYGKHVSAELKPGMALWIPPGFAHGFQALEDALFLYLVTKEYFKDSERCIKWNDPNLEIKWPIIDDDKVIVSGKDRNCPPLKEAETNFSYPI
ncbi:dTDP-4-dehydrorhamnose 3,5-epimerase [Aeropyrum pernix K1]|uniref:dTDP-4-dehydrorhamnose 3,5-epimerase n=1 Tax=Aeropyrum pernix (strain ATCC 700893 / DSM 11879 / JCM 9820 / NBRC 100138 / K1) TaxID=272557 RepID=Q9YCT3_AERPE|nr:dTDP-4-dehydrorhamnose 3,5-epimerase [Aeropyrum pernix]BAA80164.1 dTDP-4-dehydrorhamnose 3,5-epimerase [Aeropyrum pernix K1]